MINVSNAFRERLEAGEPVRMVVDITFPDGTKKTINKDIMNGDNGFSDCADSSSFPVGVTVCKTLTLSINNDQEQWKAIPADNDTLMIYDATSKANKLSPFSGIWNWIVGKLTNAVISNLQTSNKTVVGALNELNSKPFLRYEKAFGESLTIKNVRAATHGLIIIEKAMVVFYLGGSINIGYTVTTSALPDGITVSNSDRTVTIKSTKTQMITCFYAFL